MEATQLSLMISHLPYQYKAHVYDDVINAVKTFPELHVSSCAPNGEPSRKLLCLSGNLDADTKDTRHSLPLAVWLHEKHPTIPPTVFVRRSDAERQPISKHIASDGRVYHSALTAWSAKSSLSSLITVLKTVLANEMALFSSPPLRTLPPKPGHTTPVQPVTQPANGRLPRVAICPMPPWVTPRPPPSNARTSVPYMAKYSTVPLAPTKATVPQQPGKLDLKSLRWTTLHDMAVLRMEELQAEIRTELLTQVDQWKAIVSQLESNQRCLEDAAKRLAEEQRYVSQAISEHQIANKQLVAEQKRHEENQPDTVEETVVTTAPLYSQLEQLVAQDHAIEDTLYYLGLGLNRGLVSLDLFMKHVRSLARQQYTTRALICKVKEAAGLL